MISDLANLGTQARQNIGTAAGDYWGSLADIETAQANAYAAAQNSKKEDDKGLLDFIGLYGRNRMQIRQTLDPGVYASRRRNSASIGDVVNAINGIQGIAGNVKKNRQMQELDEDDRFLNDVYARNFAAWNGQDAVEFQKRNILAMQEIAKGKPRLYGKAVEISSAFESAMAESQKRMIAEQQRRQAQAGIEMFNRLNMPQNQQAMQMAEQEGPNAWAAAPRENLQHIAEGQVMNERYGGQFQNPRGGARRMGLTANTSEEARQFVKGLETEMNQTGRGGGILSRWKAEQDTPETKSKALDLLEAIKENGQYPNINWDAWENRILANYNGAFKFNEVFSAGQTSTDEAVRKEGLIRPQKVATTEATTIAGIQAKKKEGEILSESASERLGDFGASISQMGELITGIKNPDAPQGPIAQIRKVNPFDWQAQAKQQLVAATKQLVGKALEGGVLRAEDERKYEKILPTMQDTYESASLKSEQLLTMLNNSYSAKRSALSAAGYDISKFPAGYKTKNQRKVWNEQTGRFEMKR